MEKEGNRMNKKLNKRFGVTSPIKATSPEDLMFKEYHQAWRQTNSSIKEPFIPIFKDFKERHLKDLEGGPLKLYLYFAYAADNAEGHSWHGVEKMAAFFGVQTRTIDKWIKALVDRDLIYREQHGKKSSTTYLVPYSNSLIKHRLKKINDEEDQQLFNQFVSKIKYRENLYGPILDVFHLFQWSTQNGNPTTSESTQWLLAVTQRNDGVLTCHYYPLKSLEQKGINEENIENTALFNSPYVYSGKPVQGMALTHSIKFSPTNSEPIILLSESIFNEDESWDWTDYPTVKYGNIADFFEIEEKENK